MVLLLDLKRITYPLWDKNPQWVCKAKSPKRWLICLIVKEVMLLAFLGIKP